MNKIRVCLLVAMCCVLGVLVDSHMHRGHRQHPSDTVKHGAHHSKKDTVNDKAQNTRRTFHHRSRGHKQAITGTKRQIKGTEAASQQTQGNFIDIP